MKIKLNGRFVAVYNTKDDRNPAGLSIDGVYVGKYQDLDTALDVARAEIIKIEKMLSV